MTVSYTEQLPFGRFPFRLEARSGDVVGAAPLLLVKDANTVTAKCPTPEDIAAIDRDVRLWFDGDPTGGTKDCSAGPRPLTVMQSRVYRALTTMRRLQFAEPLPWTREPLYRWFVRTVRGIRFRTDIPISAAGPDRTIQIRSAVQNGSGFALAMTDRVPGGGDFRIYETFLALLVHEARHVDGKPHTCGTKDRTERELGAWGAQRALHLWMVNHTPPDFMRPELQVVSRQIATQMCAYAFCEPCRN